MMTRLNAIDRNDLRSQSLDLLRFPLAVVVLIVHVFTVTEIVYQGKNVNAEAYPLFVMVRDFVDAFLRGQSVPIYYFISGFVFFLGAGMTRKVYVRKLKNRVKSLLLPYVFWTLLAILFLVLSVSFAQGQHSADFQDLTLSWQGLLSAFWVYHGELEGRYVESFFPLNTPLWFVRNLMVVVLCVPFIYWLLQRTKHYVVLLLGIVWLTMSLCGVKTYSFDVAFFFFSLGGYLSLYRKDMFSIFARSFTTSAILYIGLGLLYIYLDDDYPLWAIGVKQLNVLIGLFFAYGLAGWVLAHGKFKPNAFLPSVSFFVYVSHSLIVYKIQKVMAVMISPDSGFSLLLVYILTIVVTLGVLLSVFYLLHRYAPRLLKVITGKK